MSSDQDREDQELKDALEQARRGSDPTDLEPLFVRQKPRSKKPRKKEEPPQPR